MRRLFTGRVPAACAVSAAMAAAFAPPAAASGHVGQQCSGVSLTAQASPLQAVAQEAWATAFSRSADSFACNGTQGSKGTPKITSELPGINRGLRPWGSDSESPLEVSFGPGDAFLPTDEPPNGDQLQAIERQESTLTPEAIEVIPVAQESVAIIVHLPSGCTATSTPAPGRLAFTYEDLQGIFAGSITEWGEITGGGDSISGTGCASDPIVPVVPRQLSGTTHVFKRFLYLINEEAMITEAGFQTWGHLSETEEDEPSQNVNTVWPTAAHVVKPSIRGPREQITKVAETPGSISYAGLAQARESVFAPPSGGANEPTFWGVLENSHKGTGSKEKITFEDPATNGDVAERAAANCAKTTYTDGPEPFAPPRFEGWYLVTTSITLKEDTYPLCGFTYVLASTNYDLLPGTSEGEATTVHDFLEYVTASEQGQALLRSNDYDSLTKTVIKKAEKYATEAGF